MRKNSKKLLSLALALVMVLGMLPAAASAAGFPPDESAYWTYIKDDQTGINLLSDPPEGMVFVYLSLTCGNSQQRVPRMADYLEENGIHAYAYVQQDDLPQTEYAIFRIGNVNRLTWPTVVVCGEDGQIGFYSNCTLDTLKSALVDHGLVSGSDAPSGGSDEPSGGSDTPSGSLLNDSSIDRNEWEVLRLTNRYRMEIGLAPLSSTDEMQMAANQRAQELTVLYDHQRPDGTSCFTVMEDYGISCNTAAENIAYGYGSSAGVVDAWLNSPGHRANIENGKQSHLGVGMALGNGTDYWSQNFAGSYNCSYSSISLSKSSVTGTAGQDLEDILAAADITVRASCSVHGSSYLPLIAAMCSGYDPNSAGAQTLTVSLDGCSTSLTVNSTSSAYTVTLDPNDGSTSDYTALTTNADGRLSSLPVPTRSGYTFNGWFTSSSGGKQVTTSTVFSRNSTIYAQWTPVTVKYNITLSDSATLSDYTTVTTNPDGRLTDLPAPTRRGYTFSGWFTKYSGGTRVTTDTVFTQDSTIYAQWIPVTIKYNITLSDGATLSDYTTLTTNADGRLPSLPDPTKSGYNFIGWFTRYSGGTRVTTDTVFTQDSTIYAQWSPIQNVTGDTPTAPTDDPPAVSFSDVPADSWFSEAVYWAVDHDITTGTSTTTFTPDRVCTETEILTFLWRAVGEPASSTRLPFTVNSSLKFAEGALRWAYGKGMIGGSFNQTASCTRAAAAKFIWQAAGSPYATGSSFTDVPAGAGYATAVAWAVKEGVTQGTGAGAFSPDKTCSRAEIVTFLYRAYK